MARESLSSFPTKPARNDESALCLAKDCADCEFHRSELETDFRSEPTMAMDPGTVGAVIGWIILHVGALAAAWCTRMAAGSRIEPFVQLTFFAAMAAVGGASWICRQLEVGLWIPSAVTLMVMVLTAVIDFRRTHEPLHSFYVTARS